MQRDSHQQLTATDQSMNGLYEIQTVKWIGPQMGPHICLSDDARLSPEPSKGCMSKWFDFRDNSMLPLSWISRAWGAGEGDQFWIHLARHHLQAIHWRGSIGEKQFNSPPFWEPQVEFHPDQLPKTGQDLFFFRCAKTVSVYRNALKSWIGRSEVPFTIFLRLQGDHYCACTQKWCHFSYFSKSFHTKN